MNFMRGRYGNDQLGWVLFIASFVLEIVGNLIRIRIIYWIGLLMFVWMIYRTLSRNIYKRQAENDRFMKIINKFHNWKQYRQQKKNGTYTYTKNEQKRNGKAGQVYCYYYCPSCKQQVRVPAGRGLVKVTCPKCGTVFEMVS